MGVGARPLLSSSSKRRSWSIDLLLVGGRALSGVEGAVGGEGATPLIEEGGRLGLSGVLGGCDAGDGAGREFTRLISSSKCINSSRASWRLSGAELDGATGAWGAGAGAGAGDCLAEGALWRAISSATTELENCLGGGDSLGGPRGITGPGVDGGG